MPIIGFDAAGMRAFRDVDIVEFISELDRIRRGDWAPSLIGLLTGEEADDGARQQDPMLVIGGMTSGSVNGGPLLTRVRDQAQDIDDILQQDQRRLFPEISEALGEIITDFLTNQEANLHAISAEDFLEHLDEVEDALGGPDQSGSDFPVVVNSNDSDSSDDSGSSNDSDSSDDSNSSDES
ncbi:type VII secretion system-associated protein [Streptomyces sp. HC307]|uniref:type VII secretion system-associated protein n=1 Tax=Streptomyces flavusporus TaxID=3385496 RepID=UPI00391747B2